LSNALKFTPTNGKVLVQTSFIPNEPGTAEEQQKDDASIARLSTRSRWSGKSSRWSVKSVKINPRRLSLKDGDTNQDARIAPNGFLRLSVTDTGAGISAEDQQKLFKGVVQFRPEVLQAGGGSGFGTSVAFFNFTVTH
jgi:signal transduction histidine kinase